MIATRWMTASAPTQAARSHGRVAHVPDDELDAPGGEPRSAPAVADDRAHVDVARTERVHDVVADEAGPACDEDDHSKFLK